MNFLYWVLKNCKQFMLLLGICIHVYSLIILYKTYGVAASIVGFLLPPLTEIYCTYLIYTQHSFRHLYIQWVCAWCALLLLGIVTNYIIFYLENKRPRNTEETDSESIRNRFCQHFQIPQDEQGNIVPISQPPSTTELTVCLNCGKKNPPSNSRCWNCAESLIEETIPSTPVSSIAPRPTPKYDVIEEIKKVAIEYKNNYISISDATYGILYAYDKYLSGPVEEDIAKKLLNHIHSLKEHGLVGDRDFQRYKQLLEEKLERFKDSPEQPLKMGGETSRIIRSNEDILNYARPQRKIGGGLYLIGMYIAVGILANGYNFYQNLNTILDQRFKYFPPDVSSFCVTTTIASLFFTIFIIYLAANFINKKNKFKIFFSTYLTLVLISKFVYVAWAKNFPFIEEQVQISSNSIAWALIFFFAGLIYILSSQRAKETFVN